MSEHRLTVPIARAERLALALGDIVYLTGEIVATAGYPTHQRMAACLDKGQPLPIDLSGGALFHLGSFSRESEGRIRPLYVNPTTSTRFNAFMPAIVRGLGLCAVAGKGGLDAASVQALRDAGAIYLSMIGGIAPLLTRGVMEVVETGWDDLIMQFRLSRLRVEQFGPLTVAIDAHGNSLYAQIARAADDRLPAILARLRAARQPIS